MPAINTITLTDTPVVGQTVTLKPFSSVNGITRYYDEGAMIGSNLPAYQSRAALKSSENNGIFSRELGLSVYQSDVASTAAIPTDGMKWAEVKISVRFSQDVPQVDREEALATALKAAQNAAIKEVLTTQAEMY